MNLVNPFLVVLFLYAQTGIAQEVYTDVATQLGIISSYDDLYFYCGGVSFYDFDQDGWDDLTIAAEGGQEIDLYKNNSGTFSKLDPSPILDQSTAFQVLWVDYDNDGDKDFYLTSLQENRLFENDGAFVFSDVTQSSGLPLRSEPTSAAAWGDYDRDGFLDLYYVNNSYSPSITNYLYKNNGDGTFSDVTLAASVSDQSRFSLAVAFLDYDNDGWPDIYVSNDKFTPNSLYRNLGNGTFQDVSVSSESNIVIDAMSVGVGDCDGNGFLDIYVTNNPGGNALLQNNGNGTFSNIGASSGTGFYSESWAANFFDFDNDMDMDLYVSGASVGTLVNSSALYENTGNCSFNLLSNIGMGGDTVASFSHAIGDFDNNGSYDIAVLNRGPYHFNLWQNIGSSGNWIKIIPEGTVSNRDAVGSWIDVIADGQRLRRYTHCGVGFLGQNSNQEIIGLGMENMVDSIIVTWPSGMIDTYSNFYANQTIRIVEGSHYEVLSCVQIEEATATNVLYTKATLSWDSLSPAVAVEIRGKPVQAGGFITFTPSNISGNLITVYNLNAATSYVWQVRMLCDPNDPTKVGAWSQPDTFTTKVCIPTDTLFASNITSSSAVLNWAPSPEASKYIIIGRKKGSPVVKQIQQTGNQNTQRMVSNLLASKVYEWAVYSKCGSGATISESSDLNEFTTAANRIGSQTQGLPPYKNIDIYPNPTDRHFIVEIPYESASIVFSDIKGCSIIEQEISKGKNVIQINRELIHSGLYLIEVISGKETFVSKMFLY